MGCSFGILVYEGYENMKEPKEKKIKKAVNAKVRSLQAEREKRKKEKLAAKKLKISDIKHGEGAQVNHMLHRVKAKEKELTFICVTLVLVIILISLYFVFSSVQEPKNFNTIEVGKFSITYEDRGSTLGNIIDLTNTSPMSDLDGMRTEPYIVEIKNTSDEEQALQIKLVKDVAMIQQDDCSEIQIPNQYIHYQINDGMIETLDLAKKSPIIYSSTIPAHEKETLHVRVWIQKTLPTEYQTFHYHTKMVVKSIKIAK